MDTSAEPLVIIASKGYLPRMHAHRILMENRYSNYWIVVDSPDQAKNIVSHVDAYKIQVTNRPQDIPPQDGIAWTRQWIEENLVKPDSWYVSLDDNIRGWTHLPEPYHSLDSINLEYPYDGRILSSNEWRSLYDTTCPFPQVVQYWREMIAECELRRTWAGGFAIETNHFYRTRKYQTLGYVRAQNAVWKNTGLPFYYWKGNMFEDFTRSVDVVARTGSVLINRYIKPIKTFFEAGGIGTLQERIPNLTSVCQELLRRYPGLVKPNKGQQHSLSFVSRKQVDQWRKSHDLDLPGLQTNA